MKYFAGIDVSLRSVSICHPHSESDLPLADMA